MKYEKWSESKIMEKAISCKSKQEMKKLFPKEYAAAKRMGLLSGPSFSHMESRTKNPIKSKWGDKETVFMEAKKFSNKKDFFTNSRSCYNAAKTKGWFEEACLHMPKNLCIGAKPSTFKWSKEAVIEEALKYKFKKDFRTSNMGAYDAAIKNKWIVEACSHMEVLKRKHTVESLKEIFKDSKTKKEAREKDESAYVAVKYKKIENSVFAHMPKRMDLSGEKSPFYKWTNEDLKNEASKFSYRAEFLRQNSQAYQAAYKRNILNDSCLHMGEPITKPWALEEIKEEALKYSTRGEFQKANSGAYKAALNMSNFEQICGHMEESKSSPWELSEIKEEALKYDKKIEFSQNSSGAYQAARKRSLLDEICSHMKRSQSISSQEQDLFNAIKNLFPKSQKLRDMKVNIPNKPHIKGFDIDIYIPELRKGIEFDGTYWHSEAGLKRGREHWPNEDLVNYHSLKDSWFASKGIKILHIRDVDWLEDKETCIKKCLEFLGDE